MAETLRLIWKMTKKERIAGNQSPGSAAARSAWSVRSELPLLLWNSFEFSQFNLICELLNSATSTDFDSFLHFLFFLQRQAASHNLLRKKLPKKNVTLNPLFTACHRDMGFHHSPHTGRGRPWPPCSPDKDARRSCGGKAQRRQTGRASRLSASTTTKKEERKSVRQVGHADKRLVDGGGDTRVAAVHIMSLARGSDGGATASAAATAAAVC